MAAPALRQVDFFPSRFDGSVKDHEKATAHFLSFMDYLHAHALHNPADANAVANVVTLFKRTLRDSARLWIEGKVFIDIPALRTAFIARFSPTHSEFANVQLFDDLTFQPGDSAEQHLAKVRLSAQRIGYGDVQIRNRFLSSLPNDCRMAVIMSAPDDANANAIATIAQKYLDQKPISAARKEVVFAATDSALTDKVDQLCAEINDLKIQQSAYSTQHLPEGSHRPRTPTRSPGSNRRRYDQHSSSRTPERQKHSSLSRDRNTRRTPFFCDYCKGPNHKWRNCFERKRDMNRDMNAGYTPRNRQTFDSQFDARHGYQNARQSRRQYGNQHDQGYMHSDSPSFQ